jgi:hypothetical protein
MATAMPALARAATRSLAAAALSLTALLGACTDDPTRPAAPEPTRDAPRLATLPSSLSGPVLVTVTGTANEAAWPYSMGLDGIIPFDSLGSFTFEYQYVMPDPNIAGNFFARIDSAFTIRSLDRNGNVLATFSAKQQTQYTNVAAWDDLTFDGGISDFYNAGLEARDMSGRPISFSLEFWTDQVRTDIIPGDPERYIALDAWDNSVFRIYYGKIEDDSYRSPGIPITSLTTTVRPYVPPGDVDADGVPDTRDQCANTPSGASVDSNGCTPAQAIDLLVPCAGPRAGGTWSSHGAYVAAVTKIADQLLASGVITTEQHGALVSARAGSTCGSRTA